MEDLLMYLLPAAALVFLIALLALMLSERKKRREVSGEIEELAERLKEAGLSCEYVPDLKTAINGTSGHVVVLGTTDMLKEIKRMDRRM